MFCPVLGWVVWAGVADGAGHHAVVGPDWTRLVPPNAHGWRRAPGST